MISKHIVAFIGFIPFQLLSQFDMTMDRISTTDVPTEITQLYYTPNNPTKKMGFKACKKNRWARCNKNRLKVHEYCQDEDIV